MNTAQHKIPHFVRVQVGPGADPDRDGQACVDTLTNEDSSAVGAKLAQVARGLADASKCLYGAEAKCSVTNVDGKDCRIPISNEPTGDERDAFAEKIKRLVAPHGWNPTLRIIQRDSP